MSQLQLPREWCSSGTKTDPGAAAAATGFVAGNPVSSASHNYVLNSASLSSREAFRRACYPRLLLDTDDTSEYFAVTSQDIGPHKQLVLCNLNSTGVSLLKGARVRTGGAVASLTASVRAAARNPSTGRLVAVGSGGNHNCTSTDGGANWSAGGALGGVGLELLWNPIHSRFQAIIAGNARYSTDAASWTNVAVAGANAQGMGLLANGNVIIVPNTTSANVVVSTNGGTSWTSSTGVPFPESGNYVNNGHVGGRGQSVVFHAGLHNDGTIRITTSPDGATWTLASVINPTLTFANASVADIRISQCVDTGLLVVSCDTNSGIAMYASIDNGLTWSDMITLDIAACRGIDVAGGRIVCVDEFGAVYVSDGII